MMNLCYNVVSALKGRTLATAESCTGGGIGTVLTSVPGSSAVYKGGIICYTNWVKENILGVKNSTLQKHGAVSEPVAIEMAKGAREKLQADIAVSVTGLAGPTGDEFGNTIGTVFVGYADEKNCRVFSFHFSGNREAVRQQAIKAALQIILQEAQ